ncbi:MAG: Fis family transcriptional regulator [Paraglaciecola sp.]|nr:Fis family transcriptional regulator [Paraglaciecola sp.]
MASVKSTVQKLDDNVVKALTKVCEEAKQKVVGFDWITHRADYSNFPNSLVITCVFVGEQDVNQAKVDKQDVYLRQLIHRQLLKAGILLKDPRRNVFFDSEEACAKGHQGNWAARLSK